MIRSLDTNDLALFGSKKLFCKDVNQNKPEKAPPSSGKNDQSKSSSGNNNDNDDKIKSLVTKIIMWIITIYTMGSFISLLTSSRSDRPEVRRYK